MSALNIELPPELIEAIAKRAAELVEPQADVWLSVAEAADHLRCTRSRIYSLVSARRIPHHKDGSRVLFRRSELDRWVEQGGAKCPS